MLKFMFWLSLAMVFYTYMGYPLLITILAQFRKKRILPELSEYPKVSIILSVYNEENFIEKKIRNCLNIDYPKDKLEILVGSDGSTDRTNEILAEWEKGHQVTESPEHQSTGAPLDFARGKQEHKDTRLPEHQNTRAQEHKSYAEEKQKNLIKIYIFGKRKGKPYVINKLVEVAKGEILFFTDARQLVYKDAFKKILRHFQYKKVGCVSGTLVYDKVSSITGRGIGAYSKYERQMRKMESDVYSMIGATGAIFACRKELFEPLPENIILDDMYTPLAIVHKGYKALFEPEALAYDVFVETPRDEHRRKVRTLSGNYQLFFKMPHMLNPFKSKIAFQIISHKLFRLLVPFFMILMFLSNLLLVSENYYSAFFIAQTLFYALVLIEALFRRHIKGILGIPYLFCVLNFSALVGLWRFLFHGINVKWEKARISI